MDIAFYYVDSDYIEFLKQYEIRHRCFTCVPNTQYRMSEKFLFGMVMTIGEINYYVPVSSKIKRAPNNIVIRLHKKKRYTDVGTLRFAYMIPVPNKMLIRVDFAKIKDYSRNQLVRDELAFCRRSIHKITQQAEKTYKALTSSSEQKILKNACDFKQLEKAYEEYVGMMPRYLETTKQGVELLRKNGIEYEARPSTKKAGILIIRIHNKDKQSAERILSNVKPIKK